MKTKYKNLAKNVILFAIGSFGSKAISFLLIPLYTSVLNTNDYGIVDLINTTVSLLLPILLLSITDATLRFSMDESYKKEDVLSSTIKVIIIGSLLLLAGILFVSLTHLINLPTVYWIFLFLTFLLSALNNCFNLYLKSKNQAKIIAISGIVCTLVTCISNIVCLLILKLGINGYMLSIILGLFIQVLIQIFSNGNIREIHFKNYKDVSKEMTKYSKPLIANSLAWWVNGASDRYIISWLLGASSNGIYSVSYKVPTILTTLQSVFYNAWSISAIAEYDKNDEDGFIGNNYTIYSCVSIIGCSIILLFNLPLAKILYINDYFQAWQCVPFLLIGTIFNGISQLEGSLFSATKKTKQVSTTTVIGAVINTIGNLILIKLFGIVGAALSTMLGYIITWLLRTIYLKNMIKMKVNWKKHIVSLIIVIAQAVLATLNKFFYIQIILSIVNILLYKEYLKLLLKKYLKSKKN